MCPYFAVGEEVILCSVNHPGLNGEYIIKQVMPERRFKIEKTGETFYDIAYDIGVLSPNGIRGWAQSALRKKHKPADQSYSELIQSTKQLVKS